MQAPTMSRAARKRAVFLFVASDKPPAIKQRSLGNSFDRCDVFKVDDETTLVFSVCAGFDIESPALWVTLSQISLELVQKSLPVVRLGLAGLAGRNQKLALHLSIRLK